MQNSIHVDGFEFMDPKTGEAANREREAVEYLRSSMDWKDEGRVLDLYVQLIDTKMFHTEVGVSFLKEIQTILLHATSIDPSVVPDIPVEKREEKRVTMIAPESQKTSDAAFDNDKKEEHIRFLLKKLKDMRIRLRSSSIIIIILMVVIGLMFGISLTGTSPTILNYRTKVKDEYAQWEKELTERERILRQKENQLQNNNNSSTSTVENESSNDNSGATTGTGTGLDVNAQ
ncbi:MAG: hypothetical protein PUB40_05940 [Lachnospiraceae bacterium]|nr:hypothetical protein [Lachnospiraceae bacterium]